VTLPDAEGLFEDLKTKTKAWLLSKKHPVGIVGIHRGGWLLVERLYEEIEDSFPIGMIDISFYRDDIGRMGLHPQVRPSKIFFEVDDCHILLVDDVLYTGRTVRAAMNEMFDYGRPASITLAVLVDRGGRELPLCPQIVGAIMEVPPTTHLDLVQNENKHFSFRLTTYPNLELG
jgi:pyrimidine operon attenuation protein/uracil phosphoribosyltransferase